MLKGASLIKRRIITQKKKGKTPVIPYITAFDPDIETTSRILLEMVETEPACVELGFPFSDPIADGPTIQKAMVRALKNAPTFEAYLEFVSKLKAEGFACPILCMTYYNILYQYGITQVAKEAQCAGLDGFIVPDLPLEEAKTLRQALSSTGLALVMLCAPTTPEERISRLAKATSGFLYYVSLTGITGVRDKLPDDLVARLQKIKGLSGEPVAVGFGISKPDHVRLLSKHADALVVGSALVKLVEEDPKKAPKAIKSLLNSLKDAQ